MANVSGAAKTIIGERDLSNSVPGSGGVHVALVVPAVMGELGWNKVTNRTQFLNRYTPHGRIDVGMPMAYQEALQLLSSFNSVYIGRPETAGMKYSALAIVDKESADTSLSNITGTVDQTGGTDFTENVIGFRLWFGTKYTTIKLETDLSADFDTVVAEINSQITGGTLNGLVEASNASTKLKFSATAGNEGAKEIRVSSFTKGEELDLGVEDIFGFVEGQSHQGKSENVSYPGGQVDPEAYAFGADELTLLHAVNPGDWGDLVEVRIKRDDTYENSFRLAVHFNEEGSPREEFIVSRDPNAVDGFGVSLYIEDVLKGSQYIRAVDNIAKDSTANIELTDNKINLGGGDNGATATDSDYVQLWEEYANTNSYEGKLMVDGGRATPAQHAKMIEVAERRIDSVALLSDPLSAEMASDYMGAIRQYKTSDMVVASSFANMTVGWQKVTDEFNDRSLWLSPATFKAKRIAFVAQNYEIWYPSAGPIYGQLKTLDCYRRFTDGELDELDRMKLSPIKWSVDGIAVWGDNSLNPIPSALSNFNNRLALTEIQPVVKKAMDGFLYRFNDEETRSLVTSLLNSALETFKGKKGVMNFKVICNDENNGPDEFSKNIMNVWILVNFHGIAKYIPVTFAITRSGIEFTDIQL